VLSRLLDEEQDAGSGGLGASQLRTLLWADFMVPGADPRKYDEVPVGPRLGEVVAEYLNDYNAGAAREAWCVAVLRTECGPTVSPG
jgi:dynein heavy chain